MTTSARYNHLGHCVRDADASIRFYTSAFGFTVERDLTVPDVPSDRLLRIPAPIGLRAVYLRLGDEFVLELLEFADAPVVTPPERVMNEYGLTHLSLSVDDIAATCSLVEECGGSILRDTDLGKAIYVRDPDGQLIELLPMSYWDHVEATRPR